MIERKPSLVLALCAAAALSSACSSSKPAAQAPPKAAPAAKPVAPPAAEPLAHAVDPTAKAGEPAAGAQFAPVEDDMPAVDGKFIYGRNCAGCHNDNGDGQGATIVSLGQKARSFAQGGFAFGNTRDAIYKTITAGMPGSSLMPSFKATLSDDERWMVADYVLTLTPKAEHEARGTELHVGTEPVIARGLLEPIAEKVPERPRGLLIGFPDGLTFEYRTDDVRLLGVRLGAFADRHDWNDRGGSPLEPLGKVTYLLGEGDPGPTFSWIRNIVMRPLDARLYKTWVRGSEAGIDYRLFDAKDGQLAEVSESDRVETLSIGGAFTRNFEIRAKDGALTLVAEVAGCDRSAEWVRGVPRKWQRLGDFDVGPLPDDGWIVSKRATGFECVHVAGDPGLKVVRDAGAVRIQVPVPAAQVGKPAQLSATIVVATEWSPELLARLAKEIAR